MPAAAVLVVEDGEAIRVSVLSALSSRGLTVRGLADGSDLEAVLTQFRPDLVVLDVMLPGRDGFELLPVVRTLSTAAVIMLTARDATEDRVRGLLGGADDYLVKPFAMAELLARAQAVLRRTRSDDPVVVVGDLELDPQASRVVRDGQLVDLTDTERRVLSYLADHQGRVVSKTQILTAVWGYDGFDANVVEVHVSSLRRKLELTGGARLVHTVRGRGYRLAKEP